MIFNGEAIPAHAGRLDLSKKSIVHIDAIEGFDGLASLQELNLSDNAIKEIQGLEMLTALRVLDLSGNSISRIQGLEQLADLRVLKLARNNISAVEGLEHLAQLRILNLGSNRIRTFSGISLGINLRILDLSNNGLETIDHLDTLGMLHELMLRNNKLRGIDGLEKLAFLRELEIDEVPIPDEIAESLGALNQLSTAESRRFIHFFSTCPVCGKENHDMSLAEFFFSMDPAKQAIKRQLLSLMKRREHSRDNDGKRVVGIPCCECFEKLREDGDARNH